MAAPPVPVDDRLVPNPLPPPKTKESQREEEPDGEPPSDFKEEEKDTENEKKEVPSSHVKEKDKEKDGRPSSPHTMDWRLFHEPLGCPAFPLDRPPSPAKAIPPALRRKWEQNKVLEKEKKDEHDKA